MAALGRWGAVDPLADQYAGHSPYNYVLGNPNSLIDPDGRAPSAACEPWCTLADLYLLAADVNHLRENGFSWGRAAGVGLGVVSALTPFVTGLGAADDVARMVISKTGDDLYAAVARQIDQLDFSTAPGEALFYSGGMADEALDFAAGNGLKTIEMTPGGRTLEGLINSPGSGLTVDQTRALWDQASMRFAEGVSGSATALVNPRQMDGLTTFQRIEEPILKSRDIPLRTIGGGN
jgi:uncharacterized protein RhaS with RHS repeats